MFPLDLRGPSLREYRAVRADRDANPARSRILDAIARLEAARIAARVGSEGRRHVVAT